MKPSLVFVLACFSALALWPLAAGAYGIDLVSKIMVYAIFALSLELLVGTTGLVCFGQAGFFGIGAYAAVMLSPASEADALLDMKDEKGRTALAVAKERIKSLEQGLEDAALGVTLGSATGCT